MCTLNEDFRTFIDERINSKFSKLNNKTKYAKINNKYKKALKIFREKLSQEQKENLENLLVLKDDLYSEELFFDYTIGLIDGIKISNYIK